MIRELLSLATTLRIVTGRRLAGPCPHCEARNQAAVERAALDALTDYDEAVCEVAGLGVAQLEAFLQGVAAR